jgi:hypothetical protein
MTLKNNTYREDYDDYDEEDRKRNKKLHQEHRRPVRNWKKVWSEHSDDMEDIEKYYNK